MNRILILVAVTVALASGRIINVPGEYATIQQGIDAAVASDIVLVAPGTYAEEIDLKAGVVVRGSGWERTTIDGGGNSGDVVDAVGNSIGPDTKLEGFTLTGAVNGGGMPGGGGVFCNSGAGPDIGNCRITGNDAGVALWNGSAAYIHNCIIDHNTYDAVSTSSFATIVNNTIHANRMGFSDNSGYGPVFMNNIVTGNSLYGIYGPSGGTQPTLTYNDVWGNATDYHQAAPGVGCDSADPLYADTAAVDYRLLAGSPCIDAGNPASQYNDPDGTRNDMGAFGGPGAPSNEIALVTMVPARNALYVATRTDVQAGFNVAMDPTSFSGATFALRGAWTGRVAATVSFDTLAWVATISQQRGFAPGEVLVAALSRGVRSAAGDSFAGHSWQFTAGELGGSARFDSATYFGALGNTAFLATADCDCDGILDLVLCRDNANQLGVYLGYGDGTFQSPRNLSAGAAPRSVVCVDLNGDSIIDLACANSAGGSVSVFIGLGGGDFAPAVTYTCPDMPQDIAAADFDADGDVDLVLACYSADLVAVLDNAGDGTFGPARTFDVAENPIAVAAADLNNDGAADLVVASAGTNNIIVLTGDGRGGLDTLARYAAGTAPCFVRFGDFNEDGNLDVVAANMGSSNISVWLGNGSGGLGSRVNYATDADPRQVCVADLNGDGHLDLAVTNKTSGNLCVFRGTGSGTFVRSDWDPGSDPLAITAGDFDSDADLDLVIGNYSPERITVLGNTDALSAIAFEPGQHAQGQPDSVPVSVQFNQPLDPQTVDSASFRVFGSFSGCRQGVLEYDSAAFTATFNPGSPGAAGERFGAVLTPDITGAIGVRFAGFGWEWLTRPARSSSGGFGTAADYVSGTEPRGSACADFDGDGDIDILTTSNSPAAVALLKNDGTGSFGAPAYTSLASDPISVYAADLDADGDVDACVFHNEPGASHLEVLRNDGAGHLSVAATYLPATLGQYVAGGDIDNDGDIDVIVTDGWGSQDNVKVMTNNGTGGLSGPVSYSSGSWARGVVVTDVDNDGDADLCVANQGNANVTVLYNDGTGAFPRGTDFAACTNPDGVSADDFNADGWVDLAVASLGGNSVAVLLNNGIGGFEPPAMWPAGFPTRAVSGNDFDGDGDIDLACVGNGTDNLAVLPGIGDGTFGAATPYSTGVNPWSVTVADYNLDGALDLANVNYGTNNVSVRFATGVGIAAEPEARRVALQLLPNPFSSALSINLSVVPNAVRIYSAAGSMVRAMTPARSLTWDGCDGKGRQLPDGVYLVYVTTGESHAARKVVLAR